MKIRHIPSENGYHMVTVGVEWESRVAQDGAPVAGASRVGGLACQARQLCLNVQALVTLHPSE